MTDRTEMSPLEAARMAAMGFDKQPEFGISQKDRVLIQSVLEERMGEYFRDSGHGHRLNTRDLSGVVADIVYAAIRQERLRAKDGA